MKILIVEDIASDRKLLRVLLESEGHTTIEAADGVEATEILVYEEVDGVITDILMPRMDGYLLCNEIRSNERLRGLPIVIYTATFISPGDKALALSVGADVYLTKPAPVGKILAALREAAEMLHRTPVPAVARDTEVLKVYGDHLMELARQLKLSALSIDVGAALMHGNTLRDTLQSCAEALVQHLGAESAAIWTEDEFKTTLSPAASAGTPCRINRDHGRELVGVVAKQRRPHLVDFVADSPCLPGTRHPHGPAMIAFGGYPLIVEQRLLGVVAIFASSDFPRTAMAKIESIADSIALGIARNQAEEDLRKALVEKTTLLQEVHHRVKNNLQVIGSLLSMQIECCSDALSTGPLNDAHSRILAMSLVHEQIYQSESLADLDFGEYIELVSDRVFDAYCVDRKRIRLEHRADPVRLSVDQAIPCGLILNELLSNTLKHAFTEGRSGTIRVSLLQKPGGWVELAVADDGAGFPAGFRWEEGRSFGLKIVATLVRQLRGKLAVTGENGATFRFTWQLPETERSHTITHAGDAGVEPQAAFSSSSKQTATFPHSPEAIRV